MTEQQGQGNTGKGPRDVIVTSLGPGIFSSYFLFVLLTKFLDSYYWWLQNNGMMGTRWRNEGIRGDNSPRYVFFLKSFIFTVLITFLQYTTGNGNQTTMTTLPSPPLPLAMSLPHHHHQQTRADDDDTMTEGTNEERGTIDISSFVPGYYIKKGSNDTRCIVWAISLCFFFFFFFMFFFILTWEGSGWAATM